MARPVLLAVIGVLVLAGSSTRAHHGYSDFFLDQTVALEGDIESILYANPHVVLTIRTEDSTVYTATWASINQVERQGLRKTTLKVGDHVIVSGTPPRDAARHEIANVREVRRPSDGWKWGHVPVEAKK
jgi:hypothetical protein